MFRGPLLLFTLLDAAQSECQDCTFDLTAWEEFSTDYDVLAWSRSGSSITTSPPQGGPSDHGTLAVHARNLQLKLDNHLTFPEGFAIHGLPPLGGQQINEELHINGLTGQASFHFSSPIVNMCFQVDHLPPVAQMAQPQIEQHLQQAEQIAPALIQQHGSHCTADGQDGVCLSAPPPLFEDILVLSPSSQPALLAMTINPRPGGENRVHLALKFSNYENSVGSQFAVRACEVETHSATQSMLAANPEAREFIASRMAEHQSRLQSLLEPAMLNTRFNFIPLALTDFMMAPAECSNNDLVQIPIAEVSTFQMGVFSVCSFVTGVAVMFGVLRKKGMVSADAHPLLA